MLDFLLFHKGADFFFLLLVCFPAQKGEQSLSAKVDPTSEESKNNFDS